MNEVAKLESVGEALLHRAGTAVPELFIINLCASMTPMPAVPRNLKGFEKYKLYQVSRQEDGRRRFRLRLGFFTSEADAEWVLNSVRNLYPTAFTGCVTQEDLRYCSESAPAASLVEAKNVPAQVATQKPIAAAASAPSQPVTVPTPVSAALPAMPQTSPAKPVVPTPIAAAAPTQNLTLATPAATVAKPEQPQSGPNEPFHVARGVHIPETSLELTDEYAVLAAPAGQPTPPAARPTPAPAMVKPAATAGNGPVQSATFISPPRIVDDYVPILDTTLTIRTLTSAEADDPNRPKWFAVQLALSEQPINLDTMPKLDIFAAYTLYSVAMMEGGSIKHALRLGFFRENVSAEAVMGYLKAFFNMPSITQIATAEYERFAESKPKLQPSPATDAKVVKLDGKRPVAAVKPALPAAAPKPAGTSRPAVAGKPKDTKRAAPPRPQSFLSRLIGRQLD